jgi:hypothetical protein
LAGQIRPFGRRTFVASPRRHLRWRRPATPAVLAGGARAKDSSFPARLGAASRPTHHPSFVVHRTCARHQTSQPETNKSVTFAPAAALGS